jgi:hypothetical protein
MPGVASTPLASSASQIAYRLRLASLDPKYYAPLEAAYANHFRLVRRLLGFGLLAWFFLPLIVLLPFKLLGARSANRRMDAFFQEHGLGWSLIQPGSEAAGFVFTTLDEGTKQVLVRLFSMAGTKEFLFSIPVPGLRVDHGDRRLEERAASMEQIECDAIEMRQRLTTLPRSTTNPRGTREGDPLNLVEIGDFGAILSGFGARWDETETIPLRSCWRMARAFLLGTSYRYSPVSPLFVAGQCQDIALQRARQTINERLHLRLWMTGLRFQGKPVWIGQIQPRHRRALHCAHLEPDHAQDRSRRR